MRDGAEPVGDEELLYRRVPLQDFDPHQGEGPSPMAFHPREYDQTGISVFRARYTTPQRVAQNDRGKRYYVAVLRARDLRAFGIEVVACAEGHLPGHAELPGLTYANRRSNATEEAKLILARKLCLKVLGPFP